MKILWKRRRKFLRVACTASVFLLQDTLKLASERLESKKPQETNVNGSNSRRNEALDYLESTPLQALEYHSRSRI